jgi:hypothetical protein
MGQRMENQSRKAGEKNGSEIDINIVLKEQK